jgi:transketolase
MNNTQQRDAFFNTLYEIAKNDKNVYLVSADMSAPSLDKFRKDLAHQYVNVGIAEQNAISIASGMALEGKKVFVYGIASFISTRCLEQIRISCGLMKIPLTIVAIGSGFSYEESGPTHHIFEDISLIRAIPNVIINNCTDSIMASQLAYSSYGCNVANYVRLDRKKTDNIYYTNSVYYSGYNVLQDGKRYILSTGIMTHTALKIAHTMQDVGVIDVHTFPFSYALYDVLKHCDKIITMEEHILNGGMGSAVLEFLSDCNSNIPVLRIGIKNADGYCYKYGGRESVIWKYYGIDEATSTNKIKEFLS